MLSKSVSIISLSAVFIALSSCNHDTSKETIAQTEFQPCPPEGVTEYGMDLGNWRSISPTGSAYETNPLVDAYNIQFRKSIREIAGSSDDFKVIASSIEAANFTCRIREQDSFILSLDCESSCAFLSGAQDDIWYWNIDLLHNLGSRVTTILKAEMGMEAVLY